MYLRTELTYAMRTLMRRQCDIAAKWVTTISQLQLTPEEIETVVLLSDIAEHLQLVCTRGWFIATITGQYLTILEAFVDNTLPYYKQYVFPLYMHDNGSLKQSWRQLTVGGIIPLSLRTDESVIATRRNAVENQRRTDAAFDEPLTHIFS